MKPSELRKFRRENSLLFKKADDLDRKQSKEIKTLQKRIGELETNQNELARAMVELEKPETPPKGSAKKKGSVKKSGKK